MDAENILLTNLSNNRRLLIVFWLLVFTKNLFCQNNRAKESIWFLPGIAYHDSSRLRVIGQFGINPSQSVKAVYVQAFIKTGKNITFNPAYLYLNYPGAGDSRVHEHSIMNAAIISIPLKHFLIEDRNLIWNRFRQNQEDLHFYRNRLRVICPFKLVSRTIKLYAFDEVWLFMNDCRFTRNRLALGLAYDIIPSFNIDVFFAREHDERNGKTNLLFIMGTLQLSRNKSTNMFRQH